jgi:histidinol-phosphate aminotransferase|tara:strand:+ start:3428 stop:4480 length:1053 start_codon:yes stop_codon:yes gene_type:complete
MRQKRWLDKVVRQRNDSFSRYDYLRLDKNEWVPQLPENLFEIIKQSMRHENFTAYPEVSPLYQKISEHLMCNENKIVVTAGSDAAIKNCFELFVHRGDKVITLEPTFAMIGVYCQLFDTCRICIDYNSHLQLNVEKLEQSIDETVSLIIIANPNSPTGNVIQKKKIIRIIEKSAEYDVPVLIDEAYYGFYPHTFVDHIDTYPNLIISRTFSKAMGLAGCRVGFLVASASMARQLYKFRPMYEANSLGILVACKVLEHPDWIKTYCDEINDSKQQISSVARKLTICHTTTETNFLHFDFGSNKKRAEKNLRNQKVLASGGVGVPGYEQFLRITLGPFNMMQPVIDELHASK